MCDRAKVFVADVEDAGLGESIPSVSSVKKKGQWAIDQANLDKQMMEEDEKAGRLRQKHLTPDDAKTMANNTKMTNDVVYVTDPALILWHKRVTNILKKKWWDVPAG